MQTPITCLQQKKNNGSETTTTTHCLRSSVSFSKVCNGLNHTRTTLFLYFWGLNGEGRLFEKGRENNSGIKNETRKFDFRQGLPGIRYCKCIMNACKNKTRCHLIAKRVNHNRNTTPGNFVV